jgi:hypothetical protein
MSGTLADEPLLTQFAQESERAGARPEIERRRV